MSNYDKLEKLMTEEMQVKEGWWVLKPKQSEELKASIAELLKSNEELKESSENLAAEVWELKSTIEFLLKTINGK